MTELKITFRSNGEKTYVVEQKSSLIGVDMIDKENGGFVLLTDAITRQPLLINMREVVTIEFTERDWL